MKDLNTYRFAVTLEFDVADETKAKAEARFRDQFSEAVVDFSNRQRYIEFHPKRGSGGWTVKGKKVDD